MICVPAWLPCHRLAHKPGPSGSDCLEAWRLLWFLGPRCGMWCWRWHNATPTPFPRPSPLRGASSSCLVVVRFSVLCRITWGGDNPALAGTGRAVREMYTRCWNTQKRRQREKCEKRRVAENGISQPITAAYFIVFPKTFHSSALSNSSPSVILSALLPWVSAVCSAAKL